MSSVRVIFHKIQLFIQVLIHHNPILESRIEKRDQSLLKTILVLIKEITFLVNKLILFKAPKKDTDGKF